MDDFRMDSCKLMHHISRVNQWLNGENIYPIYMEISPTNACNHRCIFCAFDYLNYKNQYIDKSALMDMFSEASQCGLKSVMYAGEGEPLLHKNITDLIVHTKEVGIDAAISTNGVLFNEKIARECLSSLTWIRISLDAGTKETYAEIHRCSAYDFGRVVRNLTNAVKARKENNYACTIGVQFLLLPENYQEITVLASLLKDIGVDYLVIKPFSQHPMSNATIDKNFHYQDFSHLDEQLQEFSTSNFKIIFRSHTMKKLGNRINPSYDGCLGAPFFTYLASDGNLYVCSTFLGDNKFVYGNIYENSFSEIWEGNHRKRVLHMVTEELDTAQCRENCRLDEINRYLWNLKHPVPHVNFV